MDRRAYLATTLAALGGCTGLTRTPSSTPSGPLVESGAGDYPHPIHVENSLDREVTLTITVERDGTEEYRDQHTVAAQTGEVVAGVTRESLPEGSRTVTVTATDSDDGAADVDVPVSGCLGEIVFFYDEEEALQSTYSIC